MDESLALKTSNIQLERYYFIIINLMTLFVIVQLTFGITEKEISRKSGNTDLLDFNDQVKSRVKDYIRNYMKKFGPIYKRS